jgi:hypothetical protein
MNTNTVNKNEINQSEYIKSRKKYEDEVRAFYKKMFARAEEGGRSLSVNDKFLMLAEDLADLVDCFNESIYKGINNNQQLVILYELFHEMVEGFKSEISRLSFDINYCVQDEEEE